MTTCIQKAEAYLFQPISNFDIHSSTLHCVSRTALLNFRILAWIVMTIILILLQRVNFTLFANIKFLSDQGFILTWLYFGIVTQEYWLNSRERQGGASISQKIKYIAEMLFELALCFEVPITIIEWALLFEEQSKTESKEQVLVQILEHSAPIVLLLIDMICNSCRFLRKRLFFIMAYAIAYLIINLSYSVTVEPVYDIITWLDAESYIYVAAVTAMMIGTHLLANKIFTTFKQTNTEQHSSLVYPNPNHGSPIKQMKSDEDGLPSN